MSDSVFDFGIGVDVVSHSRVALLLKKSKNRFLNRIAHPDEIILSETYKKIRSVEFWASRFAAKEAFFKALPTELQKSKTLKFSQIGFLPQKDLAPLIVFGSELQQVWKKQKLKIKVSISHEKEVSMAVVIISKDIS